MSSISCSNPERAKELECKFGVDVKGKQCLNVWPQEEKNPIANLEGAVSTFTICKILYAMIGTMKMLANQSCIIVTVARLGDLQLTHVKYIYALCSLSCYISL
jgi:hypothetical protein